MPRKHTIIPGTTYGKLTTIRELERRKNQTYVLVVCQCGVEIEVKYAALRRGQQACKSCTQVKHGCGSRVSSDPIQRKTYRAWSGLKQRCNNPKYPDFELYGGRGISYSPEWETFTGFLAQMGYAPSKEHSVDRIDCDGDYRLENCRWILMSRQSGNRRNNRKVEYAGRAMNIADWARELNFSARMIALRLNSGWSIERTLTEKPNRKYPAPPPPFPR